MRIPICLSLLFLLSGCHQVVLEQETCYVQQARDALLQPVEDSIVDGKELSLSQVLHTTLLNNKSLQAAFEQLGIAKADLVEAGLLKNPTVSGVFEIPHDKNMVTNIEVETSILALNELWQIPLRKKLYKHRLWVTIQEYVALMYDTYTAAKVQYLDLAYHNKLITYTERIVQESSLLRDMIRARQQFGFSSDLDIHLADSNSEKWHIERTLLEADRKASQNKLSMLMGCDPFQEVMVDNQQLMKNIVLPSLEEVLTTALACNPHLIITRKKIALYEQSTALEESRIFKSIDLGLGYKRDFDASSGIGPYAALEIPLFNQNQAQIAKSRYQYEREKRQLISQELMLKSDVVSHYHKIQAYTKAIQNYEHTLIKAHEASVKYVDAYYAQMQITAPMLLEIHRRLYEVQRDLLTVYFRRASMHAELEKLVGKSL